MQLVRDNLKPLIQLSRLKSAHAGLLMQRGLPVFDDGEKREKKQLVERVSAIKPSKLYELAFNRWFSLTQSENFSQVTAKVNGRLLTGLALGGTLETGVTTHHTYGMPLLAGSSIKGSTRAYAESIGLDQALIDLLFGGDDADEASSHSGAFVWHDAWWIPRDSTQLPFVQDVITVHEQSYYSEKTAVADGTESPVPNVQIGTQGEFYFVFEGDPAWTKYVADLVLAMLEEQGLGTKTASGYGYFVQDPQLNNYIKRKQDQVKLQQATESGDPDALMRAYLESLNEKGLFEALTKGKNALYRELELDKDKPEDMRALANLVMTLQPDWVASWASASGNKGKAYAFIQDHLKQ